MDKKYFNINYLIMRKNRISSAETSANVKILNATITIGLFTGLVGFAYFLREIVAADWFGTSDEFDAFLIAFLLPNLFITIFCGSFSSTVIPAYIRVQGLNNKEDTQRFISNLYFWSLVLFSAVIVILALLGYKSLSIIGSNFNHEKLMLTRKLFYILLPIIMFKGFSNIAASLLNSKEKFALAAFTPISIPLIALVFLFFTGSKMGIYALAIGTMLGYFIEFICLGYAAWKLGMLIFPRYSSMSPELSRLIGQYVPLIIGTILMSCTDLINQSMSATLEPGSVAALNYGNRLVMFITAMGAAALGNAVLPYFSQLAAKSKWSEIKSILFTYSILIITITIPLTIFLCYFSEMIINILFQRGAFLIEDTKLISQVQFMFLLQIPFYALGVLGVRLINSLEKNLILMKISAFNLIACIFGNYILMKYMGVIGIALCNSIVYLFSTILIFLSIKYILKNHIKI